ncbi:hypothetical protein [Halalkalibacter wakoensis]|nr:hypothetical protein [Halalkalibacter wakoensis]
MIRKMIGILLMIGIISACSHPEEAVKSEDELREEIRGELEEEMKEAAKEEVQSEISNEVIEAEEATVDH